MFSLGLSLTSVSVRRRQGVGGSVAISGTPGRGLSGAPYNFQPIASGGNGTKSYALTGTLPAGLSFSTASGAITGTAFAPGSTAGLNITVTDLSGSASLGAFTLTIAAAFVDFHSPVSLLWAA
jgi:hypothetical protein